MTEKSALEAEKRKRAIFDSMSERSRKRILKQGYEKWDPFQEPKDPIDIRKDKTKRTSQSLINEFFRSRPTGDYSNQYGRGVIEICLGLINEEDRFLGMYDFACWYKKLLEKEGVLLR